MIELMAFHTSYVLIRSSEISGFLFLPSFGTEGAWSWPTDESNRYSSSP